MLLKKSYAKDTNDNIKYSKGENGHLVPIVSGVTIKRMSSDGKQKFTPKVISMGIMEKWLEMNDTHIIIGTHKFKILSVAGRVCSECGEKLTDDQTGEAARQHIEDEHNGEGSYECPNYYSTQLEI